MALNTDTNDSRSAGFLTIDGHSRKDSPVVASNWVSPVTTTDGGTKGITYWHYVIRWNDTYDYKYKLSGAGSWSDFSPSSVPKVQGFHIHRLSTAALTPTSTYVGDIFQDTGNSYIPDGISSWTA
tara:strand:- start:16 stop:390 length:375 start_codon:yes stop_codon:yes gene_type:complete